MPKPPPRFKTVVSNPVKSRTLRTNASKISISWINASGVWMFDPIWDGILRGKWGTCLTDVNHLGHSCFIKYGLAKLRIHFRSLNVPHEYGLQSGIDAKENPLNRLFFTC
jgi:hypothetical protein